MSVFLPEILTSPVVLVLVCYAVLVVGLALALQPMRLRMVRLAESMLAEDRWNRKQQDEINWILDTMDCIPSSCAFPIAVIVGTVQAIQGRKPKADKALGQLMKDDRFDELTSLWFVSLLGTNPLLAVVSVPLLIVCVPIMFLTARGTFVETVEKPVLQASTAVLAAYHHRRLAA